MFLPASEIRKYGRAEAFRRWRLSEMRSILKDEVHSGLTETSDKDRRRLDAIKQAINNDNFIQDGVKLYSKDDLGKTSDQGGLGKDRAKRRKQELMERAESASDRQFAYANDKWKESFPMQSNGVGKLTDDLISELGLEPTIQFPSGPTCTFCGKGVDELRATHGRSPLRKMYIREEAFINGQLVVNSKLIHTTDKLVACPDCCLNIVETVFPKVRT